MTDSAIGAKVKLVAAAMAKGQAGDIAGAMKLVSTQTVSAPVSTLEWTGLSGDYTYHLDLSGLLPASNAAHLRMQYGEGATPTWMTDENYVDSSLFALTSTFIALTQDPQPSNTAGYGVSGRIYLYNFNASDEYKLMCLAVDGYFSAGGHANSFYANTGWYNGNTNPITAVRIFFDDGSDGPGTIAAGRASLYKLSR